MKKTLTLLFLSATLFSARAEKNSFGFIENKGQVADRAGKLHPEMLYMYMASNAKIAFQKDRIVYVFDKVIKRADSNVPVEPGKPSGALIGETRIDLVMKGSNPGVELIPGEVNKDVRLNYYLAHCPGGITPTTYQTLTYKNIYPLIDLIFKETETGLKYDIVLHKGADLNQVKFIYEGAKKISIEKGQLHVVTELYDIHENIPLAFLNDDMSRKTDVQFKLNAKNELSFIADKNLVYEKLTIDPVITWLTLFEKGAGNGYMEDFYHELTTDANGNIYDLFAQNDANMPVLNPGGTTYYDPSTNGSYDVFFAKYNSNRALVWGTYYGGTDFDVLWGVTKAVTGNGALHVLVAAQSNDIPMPNAGGGAYYSTTGNNLYANFNLATGALYHATKVGAHSSSAGSIAINSNGAIAITYAAYNFSNAPILNRAGAYNQATNGGFTDMYLMMLSNTLAHTWGTFMGGVGSFNSADLVFDSNNNLFFVAEVGVANPATTEHLVNPGGGAYYQTNGDGSYDLMIGKFNTAGALVWNTLYGGNGRDGLAASMGNGSRIICNSNNDIFISGGTSSTNLPLQNPGGGAYYVGTPPANISTGGSYNDYASFLLKFNNSGVRLWATYWGDMNGGGDHLWDLAIDKCNNLFALGRSHGMAAISQAGFYNNSLPYVSNTSSMQSFMMKFNSNMQATWASYLADTSSYKFMSYIPNTSRLIAGGTVGQAYMPFTNPGGGAYYDNVNNSDYKSSYSILELNTVPPPVMSSTSFTACANTSATLTATGGIGSTYEWYTASTGGSPIYTGSTYATPAVTTNTTFYVSSSNGTCVSDRTPVTVSVTPASTVPGSVNASSATLCSGGSSTLTLSGGTLAAGDSWQWYTGSCGGTAAGAGNSIVVSPGSTTVYYVRAEGACGNGACTSTTITLNTLSSAPASVAASNSTVCSGSTATLTLSGGSLGTGASWQWFTGSCTGTAAGTGSSITVSPSSATTYFVKAVGSCNTTTCASVTINPSMASTPATSISSSSATLCAGGSTTLTATGGSLGTAASWQWYSSSCGGSLLGTGASLVVSPGATTTYYLRAEGSCGNTACVSTAITVNALSLAPGSVSASNNTVCAGSSTTLTANGGSLGAGATWEWFSGGCTGTPVGTGNPLTVSPSGSTSYFVKAVGACNTTACSGLMINTSSSSTAATSINTSTSSLCSGGSATLSVNGGSLGTTANWQWYSGSCGGTPVGTGSSIVVSPSSNTTYYLRAEGACGNTSCVTTNITINAPSSAPASVSASSSTVCSGSTTNLTVNGGSLGTGAAWQWFTGSCTGTAAGTGSSITVSPSSATTYFVKAVGSCNTTLCSSVTVNVNTVSIAPASANASAAAICSGNSSTLTVSGGSLGTGGTWHWYANGCGTSPVATGASIVVSPGITTAYFVRAEDNCGNSVCSQVTVSVTATPSAAWTSPGTVCSGGGNINLSSLVTGNTGGTWTGTGVSGTSFNPSTLTGQTIPVTYSVANGSCSAVVTQSISVAASVSAAWSSPGTLCASNGTVDLSTYVTGSSGGTWSGSGVSGTNFDPTALSGPIAITYSIGSGACSDVKTFTINVSPAAVANWTSPGTLCASSGTVNLNTYLTGTSGGTWTGTGVSGNTFDPSGLAGQTILIGYQVGANPCIASQSHTIQVVNVANANFTAPSTLCENATALDLNTTVTGNSGGTFTGTGISGNMFNPSGLAGQSIVITYSVGTSPCGASQTRTITITASPTAPTVSVSNATICAGQTTTITATGSGAGAVYTVYSSPGAIGAVGTTPLSLSPAVTTTYYIQSVANGCSNLGGDVPLVVTVNALPNADAGNNQSLCLGSNAILTATGGGTYLWNTGATTSSISVTPTVNTGYTVTVTGANGCVARDVVTVTVVTGGNVQATDDAASVQNNNSVTVNVAANDTGDPNTVAILSGPYHGSATIGTNGTVIYTPSGTFDGTDTVHYSICDVACTRICRQAKLVITVTKETIIKVPGGFSPNGDGNNDGFVIKGLELYPDNELVIFNRWGDEVFKAAPYRNDWAGQSEGKGLTLYGNELVEGTYFYILTLDKNTPPMKGYVELKRK